MRNVVLDEDCPTCMTAVAGNVTSESLTSVSGESVDDAEDDGVRPAFADPAELPELQEAVSAATANAIAALTLPRSSPPGLRSTYLLGVTETVAERPALLMLSPAMKADRCSVTPQLKLLVLL